MFKNLRNILSICKDCVYFKERANNYIVLPNVNFYFTEFTNSKIKKKRKARLCENADSTFTCPNTDCHRVFKFKYNLSRHLKYECNTQRAFKCGHCNHPFTQRYNGVVHCRKSHPNLEVKVMELKEDQLIEWRYEYSVQKRD